MRIAPRILVALGLLLVSVTCAKADTITWTVSDVTFTNGNTLTGTFVTDSAVTSILSWSLDVTGPATIADFTVVQVDSPALPGLIGLGNADFSQNVALYLAADLTSAGGIVDIASGYNCPGLACGILIVKGDTYVDGVASQSVSNTPEPSTILLLGVGMGILGITSFRRRKLAGALAA
jgi:hypothetical protein